MWLLVWRRITTQYTDWNRSIDRPTIPNQNGLLLEQVICWVHDYFFANIYMVSIWCVKTQNFACSNFQGVLHCTKITETINIRIICLSDKFNWMSTFGRAFVVNLISESVLVFSPGQNRWWVKHRKIPALTRFGFIKWPIDILWVSFFESIGACPDHKFM